MAFNQLVVKSASTGAATAFTAPLASLNGSLVSLNGKAIGSSSSSAGLVIACAGPQWNIEWDSLAATVETRITTLNVTVTSRWEVSQDGVNWLPIYGMNAPANVTVAAAGTGSAVVTQYVHSLPGVNPGFPYLRLAAVVGGAAGGAADAMLASYNFRKRWTGA